MERIDGNTWRTDKGDEVRARGLRLTVEFGEKTKAEVLCAVEAVRAENERLEKRLAQYELFCEVVGDPAVEFASLRRELHRVERENAKLRELCADMWRDIPKTESCGWDTSTNTCTGSDECIGECSYWYRMHDLGIEVTP